MKGKKRIRAFIEEALAGVRERWVANFGEPTKEQWNFVRFVAFRTYGMETILRISLGFGSDEMIGAAAISDEISSTLK